MDNFLDEGDRIELSRSHELKIDGDGNWVGIKISTQVLKHETAEEALERLSNGLEEAMDIEINRIVEYVRKKG